MRTTVTIDDQLLTEVKQEANRTHRTIGAVIEDALRDFLRREPDVRTEPFRLPEPEYDGGLRPGVDLFDKGQMADLLPHNAAI